MIKSGTPILQKLQFQYIFLLKSHASNLDARLLVAQFARIVSCDEEIVSAL